MRIWHRQLIPLLCRNHLLSMWREGLGAYSIITKNKKGYSNHPAIKEFKESPHLLWLRLHYVRQEMLKRGYKPKELPDIDASSIFNLKSFLIEYRYFRTHKWQSLDEQIEILKNKKCLCDVN